MARYVIGRRATADDEPDVFWDASNDTSIQVHEPDDAPVNTGLVTATGAPIMRLPDKRRVGF